MNRMFVGIAGLTLGLVTALGGAAAQQDRMKAGTLDCDVSGGIGMIIGSQKGVRCEFTPDLAGPREYYVGTISKFGLDIGATSAGRMVWAVFAPSTRSPGVLAGTYVGGTAEATAIAGVGANALVGGSNRTVALQPLSITGQTGLNLAAGVASLELRSSN